MEDSYSSQIGSRSGSESGLLGSMSSLNETDEPEVVPENFIGRPNKEVRTVIWHIVSPVLAASFDKNLTCSALGTV